MQIRSTGDNDAAAWNRFVDTSPDASAYHRYAWRGYFGGYFGKATDYLAAVDTAGEWRGVLPLVQLESALFGRYMVSLPFVNYGGLLAHDRDVSRMLVEHAGELAGRRALSHVEFRHTERELDLPVRTDKVAMLLELPPSADALAKSLGSKRRSQINRPRRENPEVIFGGAELLPEFYAVFSRNMRDLGTPVYAVSMFADILGRFPHDAELAVIRVAGEPAAAGFLLCSGERMEIPWASTRREYNRISINMLLYWEVIVRAIGKGLRLFDFGRSTVDSGTYRFKRQWGAEPRQLTWHYWLQKGREIPQLNPGNRKYRLAISAWKRLPLGVANALGPLIVKHLP